MKRRDDQAEIPLSALIDIVFLLIIFFIVTASLQREVVDYQIKLAKSYYVKPPDQVDPRTFTVNIRHEVDEQGRYKTATPVYSIRGVNYTHNAIRARLMRARERYGDDMPVVIRASAGVKYREIELINAIILDAGLYRVNHSTESQYNK